MSILFRHRYENVSGFCTGTVASSLHKMAVWSDVSPWCSFSWKTLSRADGIGCE